MKRRNFIKAASAIPFLSYGKLLGQSTGENILIPDIKVRPPRLKKGDTVGLITPGSPITEDELKESITNLSNLGFEVIPSHNAMASEGYLAGSDKQRADDIHEMFSRKDINGIFTTRGGYGCTRILPYLDYKLIRKNPKVFVGYSDVTALLYGIYKYSRLVCFHGPVGISTFNDYSVYNLQNVITYTLKDFTMHNSDDNKPVVTIRSGKAKGELIGGNLSLVSSLVGTTYDVDTKGKLLFLEEVDEEPYRIDRMLTQMREAGKFDGLSGLILGTFHNCKPKPNEHGKIQSFSLLEVIYDRLGHLNIPIVYGMSIGHINSKLTIPVGAYAEMDSVGKTITLLENSVI